MKQLPFVASLAGLVLAASAHADPINFFDVQYTTSAIALTNDGPAGVNTLTGVLSGTDALSVAADSIGALDAATSGAVVGWELLTTSADVSAGSTASAVASTQFTGSFINGASVNLSLDFLSVDSATGTGTAATSLFVSLVSNGVTLFSDFVTGPWTYSYAPTAGSTSVLSLTLTSEVSAAFPAAGAGNASAFGMVGIASAVPEASSWLMFSLGLGAMGLLRLKVAGARKA